MTVIDLGAARFNAAKSCSEIAAKDALIEAARRIGAGEWKAHSVIVIGIEEFDDGATVIELVHGGPANTTERLGMYLRAQDLSLRNMSGDYE